MSRITLPEVDFTEEIPRYIHQTYPNKVLPLELQKGVDQLIAANPSWTHILYDDVDIQEFIVAHYGRVTKAIYDSIGPEYGAARADLFRYLVIYKLGGVYLDIKSTALKPFDQILKPSDLFILAQWSNSEEGEHAGWGVHEELDAVPGGEFQQWHVIAAPGHPYLKAVIELVLCRLRRYKPWRSGVGQLGTLRTTGPIAYTEAIAPLLEHQLHRKVGSGEEFGLAYSIFGPASTDHISLFKRTYHASSDSLVRPGGLNSLRDRLWSLRLKVEQSHKVEQFRRYARALTITPQR